MESNFSKENVIMNKNVYFPKELEWMWNARYSSWLFTYDQVFNYSVNDFEKKAKALHNGGINTVIIAGFHFRWDWYYLWPELTQALVRIVNACHKYGIRVIEHHSSVLKSFYPNKEELEIYKKKFDLNRYPWFSQHIKDVTCDPVIDNIPFSSMYQVDIRTGEPSWSYYHGHIFCFNNPDYQRIYFRYLEDLYRTGIDGIMTDDIQFMPCIYSCGCYWCRKLFTEQHGYEIPEKDTEDRSFFFNFDNPAFRAFIRFRSNSHIAHHHRVNEHFQKLGYIMARPNYCSASTSVFGVVGTGYDLEGAAPCFNTVFTEICHSEEQLSCWAWTVHELKHKSALAARYRIPAMALFYSANQSQGYFHWALSKILGQNLWLSGGSGSSIDFNAHKEALLSKQGNVFQQQHPKLYIHPVSCARVAVFFSRNTMMNYQAASGESFTNEYAGWCQQLFKNNILFDVILDDDIEDISVLKKYDLIILPNTACMSDVQTDNITQFVKEGGGLIATFETGHYDQTGEHRKIPALQELFGIKDLGLIPSQNFWKAGPDVSLLNVQIPFYIDNCRPYRQVKPTRDGKIILESVNEDLWPNSPVYFKTSFGRGNITYFSGYIGSQSFMPFGHAISTEKDRNDRSTKYLALKKASDPCLAQILVQSVRNMLGEKQQLLIEGAPEGILAGLYQHGEEYVLHLLNASKTLRRQGETFGGNGKWNAKPCGEIHITLRFCPCRTATLFSPDFEGSYQVPVKISEDTLNLTIKAGLLQKYSVINLK